MTDLLAPAAAGALLGVGPDRIAQLVRDGTLKATRTPGGHLRVAREEVERLSADPPTPTDPSPERELPDDARSERDADDPRPTHRKGGENVAPWKQRVREAQADVQIVGLDDKKERIQEARAERQAARERADADRQVRANDEKRLRELKSFAVACYVGYDVPVDIRAEVAREVERIVTSARYPREMSSVHAYALLKADVDRCLTPWRDRQAAAARADREPKVRELTILTAVVHVMRQIPDEWDTELRTAFQQDCRQAVGAEYHTDMDQDEASAVAQDVLNEWLNEDDDELEDTDNVDDDPDDDDFDDDDADEEEDHEDDDGDDW
jgi:excisionase family DNA binding protein